MYLRKSKKGNGRVYLTIVEGCHDERGKNMSRTVESLGYVDDLERSGIADPIEHFTEECARRNEARRAGTEPVIAKISPCRGSTGAMGRRASSSGRRSWTPTSTATWGSSTSSSARGRRGGWGSTPTACSSC